MSKFISGGSIPRYPRPRTEITIIPAQPVSTIGPWATFVPPEWFNNHTTAKRYGHSPVVARTAISRTFRGSSLPGRTPTTVLAGGDEGKKKYVPQPTKRPSDNKPTTQERKRIWKGGRPVS